MRKLGFSRAQLLLQDHRGGKQPRQDLNPGLAALKSCFPSIPQHLNTVCGLSEGPLRSACFPLTFGQTLLASVDFLHWKPSSGQTLDYMWMVLLRPNSLWASRVAFIHYLWINIVKCYLSVSCCGHGYCCNYCHFQSDLNPCYIFLK